MVLKTYSLSSNLRADAFPHVDGYTWSKVVETKTFVDAMVYLCLRPRDAADLDDLVHYE